jgi:hypothetical protein
MYEYILSTNTVFYGIKNKQNYFLCQALYLLVTTNYLALMYREYLRVNVGRGEYSF